MAMTWKWKVLVRTMAMLELIELIMKKAVSLVLLKTMVILFVMLLLTLRIVFCPLSVLEIKGNMHAHTHGHFSFGFT